MKFSGIILSLFLSFSFGTAAQYSAEEDQLLEALKSAKDDVSSIDAHINLGKYFTPYDYSKALYYLQQARSLAEKNELTDKIAWADFWSSRVYYYMDDYLIAKSYLERAKANFERIGAGEGLAHYFFALGEIEMLYGNYQKAIVSFQTSLELEKENKDERGISICLNGLAGLHREQGNYDLAMHYARESLKIKQEIVDSAGIATCYTSLGIIFEEMNELDSAHQYLLKGYDLRKRIGEPRRISSSNYHLGRLLIKKADPLGALDYLDRAYMYYEKFSDKTGQVIVLLEKGKAYFKIGDKHKGQSYVDQAHSFALLTKNNNLIKDTYRSISDYHIMTGDYHKGHEFYLKYSTLSDSILNWRKSKLLEETELKYQNQLKDKEIANLKSKNAIRRKNNIILILGLITLLILAVFIFFLYRMKAQRLEQKNILLEKEKVIYEQENRMKEHDKMILHEKLESKNRELGARILTLLRMNELQENIVQRLSSLTEHIDNDKAVLKELNGIIRELESHGTNRLWEDFDKTFKSIHADFYTNLLTRNPELSPSEIKIAAFLKLNLSTKEIAALTFKTESGIKSTRHRLRKKLGLKTDKNLVSFLMKL